MTIIDKSDSPTLFAVSLPQSWFELDLSRPGAARLARDLDRRIAENPDLRTHRAAILDTLRAATDEALAEGVVFAAALAEPLDDGSLLLATAAGVLTEAPIEVLDDEVAEGEPPSVSLALLASQVTTWESAGASALSEGGVRGREPDVPTWRRLAIGEVEAGPCLQVHGIDTIVIDDESRGIYTLQTLVPIPRRSAWLTFALTTPHTSLHHEFGTLFHSIASTISWVETEADLGTTEADQSERHSVEEEH